MFFATVLPGQVLIDMEKIIFQRPAGFYETLKKRVNGYFENRPARDHWFLYAKAALIFTWAVGSYIALVFFVDSWWSALLLVLSLSFAFSAIGFNIQHDGGHESFSRSKAVNRIMAFTLDLIGGSSVFWRQKHNIQHHTYTNINGMDEDIYDGSMFRLSPEQPLRPIHRFQHFYTFALYAFLSLKWVFFDDWKQLILIKMGKRAAPTVSGSQLALFVAGKAFHLSYTVILPLVFHPVLYVVLFNLIFHFVLGLTLALVFQMAHATGEAAFPVPREDGVIENEWAVHQVETTSNFAMNNPVVGWFTGGLNFQIEHHLFPRISHVHYRSLSKIVQQTCAEYGVKYYAYPGVIAGFLAHYRWLRSMGQQA